MKPITEILIARCCDKVSYCKLLLPLKSRPLIQITYIITPTLLLQHLPPLLRQLLLLSNLYKLVHIFLVFYLRPDT